MTIKNKYTGKVEVIRCNYNWVGSVKSEIVKIKNEWKDSDYKVLSVSLY